VTDAEDLAAAKERGWRELGAVDDALDRGLIDQDEWHRRVMAAAPTGCSWSR
jgi:hypothetical protein